MSSPVLTMTEAELQHAIIEGARLYGWRVAHFRPAMTVKGWRTPVQGDAGFPDLVLSRRGVTLFWELKSASGTVTAEQAQWIEEINRSTGTAGVCNSEHRARVVRPSDLDWALEQLR